MRARGKKGGSADSFLEFACATAVRAGRLVHQRAGRARSITFKGEVDMVTDADRDAQALIEESILRRFPDHGIMSEEQLDRGREAAYRWVIDPIDGTTNFVHGYPVYCVSVALEHRGRAIVGAVYNPCRDELFSAVKGGGARLNGEPVRVSRAGTLSRSLIATGFSYSMRQKKRCLSACVSVFRGLLETAQGIRRDGAAALDLCSVACGRVDGFYEEGLKPWDVAAGKLIVEEAGGKVTDYFGRAVRGEYPTLIASNGRIHGQMKKITSKFWCRAVPAAGR
jgi:myo-inositol-1(or 4)-monophosphatase